VSKRNIFLLAFVIPFSILAQSGGQTAFSFVDIETSSRVEALGGSGIAIFDNDVSLSQTTPSLLNAEMHNQLVFAFGDYFSDISLLSFAYAREFEKLGVIGLSLKALNYGSFERNNIEGYYQGKFSASDQVLTMGIGKRINDKLTFGANINLLNSVYDTYKSFALTSNISTTYFNKEKRFTTTFLLKNIGRQLGSYASEREEIPFNIQFAISKELAHLPFRYHLFYGNINKFNIKSTYKLTQQTNIETGELELKEESIAKTALRHIIIGGELNPFRKSFFLRAGFNFQRRFDLTTVTSPAMVGFSLGVGFKVSKYRFDYSRSAYHLAVVPNNFSITANLSTFGL
jgi:hypothetical protein